MSASKQKLAVLCLINNNEAHTRGFIRFFTAVPDCRLILFFDDPAHIAFVDSPPDNLTMVPCDEAYWNGQLGRQPADMPEKQHTNVRRGAEIARELGCEWAISVDSDEQISNLEELISRLDELGEGYELLRLRPAELVHTEDTAFDETPFAGHLFKYSLPERRIGKLLRKLPPLLAFRIWRMRKYTRRLFFGHFNGKTIFDLNARIDTYKQHKQFSDERELTEIELDRRFLILHHDAMNYEEWRFKWRRRISGSTRATAISDQRKMQTRQIADCLDDGADDAAARRLFRKWYVFNRREVAALKKVNYLFDLHDAKSITKQ